VIIGLSGKALSGKDTTADYLLLKHNFYEKVGFAKNLKEMCIKVFSLTEKDVYNQDYKGVPFTQPLLLSEKHLEDIIKWISTTHIINGVKVSDFVGKVLISPRDVLQYVGTDIIRSMCDTYHSDIVEKKIHSVEDIVVSDVRFNNEVKLIKDCGGFVVRINRDFSLSGGKRKHQSEVALDDFNGWDYILNNNSSLNDLYKDIDEMILFLKRKIICQPAKRLS
jgi:hypothetical protein